MKCEPSFEAIPLGRLITKKIEILCPAHKDNPASKLAYCSCIVSLSSEFDPKSIEGTMQYRESQ